MGREKMKLSSLSLARINFSRMTLISERPVVFEFPRQKAFKAVHTSIINSAIINSAIYNRCVQP